jgi:probable addiction module antidote protein
MPLNFRDDLLESLKDPKEAEAFLDAALAEDEPATFLELLRLLAQSKGGMAVLAKRSHIHRVAVYKMLSKDANPSFRNVLNITKALGYQMKMARETGKVRHRTRAAVAA